MFLFTAKKMWDTLKVMYENEKNLSRVLRFISTCLSSSREINLCLNFYGELKSLIDELEMHQPLITDAATLRRYHQNLAVLKFLFGLSLSL